MTDDIKTTADAVKAIESKALACKAEAEQYRAAIDKLATESPAAYAALLVSRGEIESASFDSNGQISGYMPEDHRILRLRIFERDPKMAEFNADKARGREIECLSR